MKKIKITVFALAIALCFCFGLAACNRPDGGETSEVTISLTPTQITLDIGDSATITAEVKNFDGIVEWESSNTDVATVSKNGEVLSKATGTATITATAGEKKATCVVTVTADVVVLHEITFVTEKGNLESQNIKDGNKLPKPQDPSVRGYHVENWYTDAGFTVVFDFATQIITSPKTLYAKWAPNVYTITYNYQGADSNNSEISKTVVYDAGYTLVVPQKTDSSFYGWYTLADGKGLQYTDETGVSINNWTGISDITLFACWNIAPVSTCLTYTLLGNGTYSVSLKESAEIPEDIVIPDTNDDKPVTVVAASAFKNNDKIISIKLPAELTDISNSAFENCSKLTVINLPNGLKYIGANAFSNCTSLEIDLVIPDTVTSIGASAFSSCSKIKSVKMSSKVTSIGSFLFSDCGMSSIELPSGLTSIENSAFSGCNNLESLTIPDSVASELPNFMARDCTSLTTVKIGKNCKAPNGSTGPFVGCTALKTIILDSDSNYMALEEGVLFNKAKTTLICYPAGLTAKNYTFPNSVTSTFNNAFDSALNLEGFVLNANFTSFGFATFGGAGLKSVTVPAGVNALASDLFGGCQSLKTVVLNSVTIINSRAFKNCVALDDVTLPQSSLVSISTAAFDGCSALERITVPASVTEIGLSAFANCTSLKAIYFMRPAESSADVPVLGIGVFTNCHANLQIFVVDTLSLTYYRIADNWLYHVSKIEVMPAE